MANHILLSRKLKDKSFYSKDPEKVLLWVHLLLSANWKEREEYLGGKPYICLAGEFTTGRKQLSMQTGISESKIERILTYFEKIEQQIEQRKTSTNRLISILNWSTYQQSEQQNEQQVNNDRTTSEQQVNTLQSFKHLNNESFNSKESEIPILKFNFKKSFIDLGVEEKIITDWLVVRKLKKGANTETAFNKIKNQIEISKISANECIKIAVEKSWSGFEAKYLENINYKQNGTYQQNNTGSTKRIDQNDTSIFCNRTPKLQEEDI